MRLSSLLISYIVLLLTLPGCLSSTYRIKHRELKRLANTAPQERSKRVRVVQRFEFESRPAPAPGVGIYYNPVVVVGSSPPSRGVAVDAAANVATKAESAQDAAKAITVLAVLAAAGIAMAEGPRYDGWVELHPDHPVHLRQRTGAWYWTPMSKLDPATVAHVEEAVVTESEGPWRPVGRAPLDRVGFTYGVELGGAGLASVDGAGPGFMTRVQFGGFPTQNIGLILNLGYGWGENQAGYTLVNQRVNLELHGYAPRLGKFNLGGYAQAGIARRVEDQLVGSRTGSNPMLGGGLLAQLELTTRLAITGRAGVAQLMGTGSGLASEYSLGVSIY